MEDASLSLVFKYARCFNGFGAWGSFEDLGDFANGKLYLFGETGVWVGSARELRACLFFEQRRWSHFGYAPEGDELGALLKLFDRIQYLILAGDLAPNDPPETNLRGCPAIIVDGTPCRLLEWEKEEGLLLTLAWDKSGEVVKRRCPDSIITPDDPSLFESVKWLFESDGNS